MSESHSNTPTWHKYDNTPDTDTAQSWGADGQFWEAAEHFDKFVVVKGKGSGGNDTDAEKHPTAGTTSAKPTDADTAWCYVCLF